MFSLITTLLLAATGLLAGAEKATTCEGNFVHRLSCDVGVISVTAAMYGRADTVTCSEGRPPQQLTNTQCSLAGAFDVVKSRCDGRKVCELSASVFSGTNPCDGIYKYMETTYQCSKEKHYVACEEAVAKLECADGQVIAVSSATYGRNDTTTCIDNRPSSQFQDTDCSRPTDVVAARCNGRSSCAVRASNSVFGDPCVGTYKYLELAYSCQESSLDITPQ